MDDKPEIPRIYHCICGESDIEFPEMPTCQCGTEMSTPENLLHIEIDGWFRLHLWPDRVEMREKDYHPEWRVKG